MSLKSGLLWGMVLACHTLSATALEQIIAPSPSSQSVAGGASVSVDAVYSTANPASENLTGLGLRLHWDSSKLTYDNLTDTFSAGIQPVGEPSADSGNFDGDAATDRYVLVAWLDISGQWTGVGTTPQKLYTAHFTTAADFSGSTQVRFSASSTAAGATFQASTATVGAATASPVQNLITHYYNHILDRSPDAGGLAFWDGENTRLRALAVESKEAFIVMAVYFFNSAEYLARNTDNATFLGHLYRTFFNREADQGGLDYWLGQINAGMPRDIVMFNFLFSPEFDGFMDGYLVDSPSRAEVLAVMDFYRGILNRIPETEGLNSWIGQFRSAQCLSAEQVAGAVYRQAGDISWAFLNGAEYLGRGRTDAQYVSDLYNAFMRRGGDLGGVNYWIDELTSGAQDREALRQAFIDSPEFQGRVQAIVGQGCLNLESSVDRSE